jgi:hypothetical protein
MSNQDQLQKDFDLIHQIYENDLIDLADMFNSDIGFQNLVNNFLQNVGQIDDISTDEESADGPNNVVPFWNNGPQMNNIGPFRVIHLGGGPGFGPNHGIPHHDNMQHILDETVRFDEEAAENQPTKTFWEKQNSEDPELEQALMISKLESVIITDTKEECAICLCDLDKDLNCVKPSTCSHIFHLECMYQHIKMLGGTCPVCRTQI